MKSILLVFATIMFAGVANANEDNILWCEGELRNLEYTVSVDEAGGRLMAEVWSSRGSGRDRLEYRSGVRESDLNGRQYDLLYSGSHIRLGEIKVFVDTSTLDGLLVLDNGRRGVTRVELECF